MVGTRNASALGARMARRLARDLGEAGLSSSRAWRAGSTRWPMRRRWRPERSRCRPGGSTSYTRPRTPISRDASARPGCRLSEMPFGLQPQGRHFPRRNRIVSGLAEAVIVVEAAARSGSLITARCALDQGREVMAVPGHPLDSRASGGNILLRDGATLVRGADDVIEALGAPATSSAKPVVAQSQLTPVSPRRNPAARRRGGAGSLAPERHAAGGGSTDPRHRPDPARHCPSACRAGDGRPDHTQPRRSSGLERSGITRWKTCAYRVRWSRATASRVRARARSGLTRMTH
jgi:hypothetical protein